MGIITQRPEFTLTTVGTDIERLTRYTSYHGNFKPRRSKTDMRANFFSDRVIRKWKKLITETKEAKREFKTLLDAVGIYSFELLAVSGVLRVDHTVMVICLSVP